MKKLLVACAVLVVVALCVWAIARETAPPRETATPSDAARAATPPAAAPRPGPRPRDVLPAAAAEAPPAAVADTPVLVKPVLDDGARRVLADLAAWDAATPAERQAAADQAASIETEFKLLKLETFSCGGQTHEVAVFAHEKSGLEFVLLPGGTFQMGSPTSERERSGNETQHAVTLTRPFLVCRTECPQAAYEKVVGSNPSTEKGPTLPVETVTWKEAAAFCAQAALRLPTEAEWEYACRAGTTTPRFFGDDAEKIAEFAAHSGSEQPVASRKPNAFGLFDLHGNVWEWCADWYVAYLTAAATDPAGPATGDKRVFRGGSFENGSMNSRSADRGGWPPDTRYRACGFRPAKSVGP